MNRITIYWLLLFTSILAESAQAENGKLSGYMFGDRLLRPALVAVAKKKNSKIEEKEEKKVEK